LALGSRIIVCFAGFTVNPNGSPDAGFLLIVRGQSRPTGAIKFATGLHLSGYKRGRLRMVGCMKQFIAEIWSLIVNAKREGATYREIYEVLAENSFPGTYTTFYTYCLEVSKMTSAQRTRLAKS
jgi:hypothetical protein